MKNLHIRLLLAPLALMMLMLCACGPSNTVKLLPPPPLAATTLPAPNAPSVSIVSFADDRADPGVLGTRRDGTVFVTTGDVPVWMSRGLADELAKKGFRVTFATSVSQARSGNPDYLLTGKVLNVWIKENSTTELSVALSANCTFANRKGRLWSENFNTSQTLTTLPSGSTADNLLLSTLEDLMKPIVQKITQTIESKR